MTRLIFALAVLLALSACASSPVGLEYCNRAARAGVPGLAIELYTRCIDSGDVTQKHLAIAYNNRGNAYYLKGQYYRAIQDYGETINLEPDDATVYNSRGNAYYLNGHYDRAIRDFDEAISLKPDYAKAYSDRGTAYYRKGQYDRAIADLTEAIRLRPRDALALNNRGSAYDDRGDRDGTIEDYDRAIADFTRAIELDTLKGPRKAWPFNNRGNTYKAKGQYDRAFADFDQAIRVNPNYAIAFANRGIAYERKGEYERAIADYEQAIRLTSDYGHSIKIKSDPGRARSNLAGVLASAPDARLRDGPRAVRLAEKAVSILDDAHNQDHQAMAYAEAGRFRDAVDVQERAVYTARLEGSSASDIADMEDRLRLYRQGQPYRVKR